MNNHFKKICAFLMSIVMFCGLLSSFVFYPMQVSAAMTSDVRLKNLTLSRTAHEGTFVKKSRSGVIDAEYKYTYYTYEASWPESFLYIGGQTDLAKNMDLAHPRLLIRDFSDVLEKIDNDYTSRSAYRNLKASADAILNTEPQSFYLNERDNINDFSGTIESNLMILSFVYNIEKLKTLAGRADAATDYEKYAVRVVREIEVVSEYKHWSQDAFLCTAEIGSGFAFAYDWLYDYFMRPENAEKLDLLRNTLFDQAIAPYLYNYIEGKTGTNFVQTISNWNPVCNGSAIVIGIAMYEPTDSTGRYSTICNYLFERGAEALWLGLQEYADGGFYREGLGYWGYATEYLTRAVSTYEGVLPSDYKLPERFTHILAEGVDETGYYPVYLNGIANAFNFGDCASAFTLHPSMIYLANRFDKPELAAYFFNIKNLYGQTISDRDAIYTLAWYEPEEQSAEVLDNLPRDKFHASDNDINILSMRSAFDVNKLHRDNAFVAMQGGKNLANHMGYSMGTFVIDMNGKRFVKQLGTSNDAYGWSGYNGGAAAKAQYYIRRAEGNNTMIFDPMYSPETGVTLAEGEVCGDQNPNAFVTFVDCGTSDNVAYGVMDMTSTNVRLKKWYRGVLLADNRRRVVVQDEIEAADSVSTLKDVYWFAHIGNASCEITDDGKTAVLTVDGVSIKAKITKGPGMFELVDAKPLDSSPNPEVQQSKNYGKKLQIHMTNIRSVTNVVEFAPADTADSLEYTAISEWESLLSDSETEDKTVLTYLNTNNYELDWYEDDYTTYFIHDDKDLAGLAYMVNSGVDFKNKTVKLVGDITLNSELDWVPIGTRNKPFSGKFDGSQRTISNLHFNNAAASEVGLFGYAYGAELKNVMLSNAIICANADVGVLCGVAENTNILNVFVYNGEVTAQSRLGGIAGTLFGGSIHNTGVVAKVFGYGSAYGGIAGYVTGVVDNCAARVQLCREAKAVVTNQETGATELRGVILGSDSGGVVGISSFGDVRNSYYLYDKALIGHGILPLSKSSTNVTNTLGKFDSSLSVSNIASTGSVLGFVANGKNLSDVMNCWIDAQAQEDIFFEWETVEDNTFGMYSRPKFAPETVVDTNADKAIFKINDAFVNNGKIEFTVKNKKMSTLSGCLVVVQTKADGDQTINILPLTMNFGEVLNYTVDAQSGANVKIFVIDSFFTLKIKSNILVL